MHLLAHRIARSPVVSRTSSIFVDVEVFGVVDVLVRAGLYAIQHLSSRQPSLSALIIDEMLTRGSRSSRIARGMYRVSSDW